MKTIKKIKTKEADFGDYKKLTPQIYKKAVSLSKKLKNKQIIHINSTQLGGGVSELLRNQIPLEKSLGLDSHWYIIDAPIEFFKTTKKIHNLLQGEKGALTKNEENFYLNWLRNEIAPDFKEIIQRRKPDVLIIHDPQPLPLIDYVPENMPNVLRIHIDLSEPNPHILKTLKPLIEKYQLTILSHPDYRPKWMPSKKTKIIMPAINPFSLKNKPIEKSKAESILNTFQINTHHPIVSQVSRFDPWKDPLGALKAYYIAKNEFPELQIILAGLFHAKDDPQAFEVFEKVKKQAEGDPDVFLFADPKRLKEINDSLFISAIYTASSIIIQKSIKEGFGLTVTEAMWKSKPVIGGQTPGIALQIKHNKTGFLVSSPEQAGQYLIKLLKNPSLGKKTGQAARKNVKNNFLLSRFVLEHLELYSKII